MKGMSLRVLRRIALWAAVIVLASCIVPAEAGQLLLYDASLGTFPTAQGFSFVDTPGRPSPIVTNGVLRQFPDPFVSDQVWFSSNSVVEFGTNSFVLEAGLHVISSN